MATELPSDSEVDQYIASRAPVYGIDPKVAVQVSRLERASRSTGWVGDHGTSFGPFQLHVGGGLGDTFRAVTGLDPRNISQTWNQQVDFTLATVSQTGWEPWHAAARAGIGVWDGIKRGVQAVTQQLRYFFPVVGYNGDPKQTYHTPGATDLFAPEGTLVRAIVSGRVASVDDSGPGGNSVEIVGVDGLQYYYAHMRDKLALKVGDFVAGGQRIGLVGKTGNAANTGSHLHIGIGHGISAGTGANGGAGFQFDAQTFLSNLLQLGGSGDDAVGQTIDTAGTVTGFDLGSSVKSAAGDVLGMIHQNILNYVQDRTASLVLLGLGILLVVGGVIGMALQSNAGKTVVKTVAGIAAGPAGTVASAAV